MSSIEEMRRHLAAASRMADDLGGGDRSAANPFNHLRQMIDDAVAAVDVLAGTGRPS